MVCPVSDSAVKSSGEVAVSSCVAMSNVTPPAPAGDERFTTKSNDVVPALPSLAETSVMVRLGRATEVLGVIEKLSTASPSSAPGAISESDQRIQKEAPLGMLKPVIEKLMEVWFPDALPFNAPAVRIDIGAVEIETVVVNPGASRQAGRIGAELKIETVSGSLRFVTPARHISPTYETSSEVTVLPVLFVNCAPMVGFNVPLNRVPKARSVLAGGSEAVDIARST